MARTMRWAIVGSGTRKARAISSVVRPPSRRSVSATRASAESTGWQAVKIEAQEVVADLVVERGIEIRRSSPSLSLELAGDLLVLALEHRLRRSMVDRAMLGGGHEPGARVVRDARLRPLLERGDQRILCQVLREPDVAHDPREAGDESRRLDPPDRVDRAMGVGSRHDNRSDHLRSAKASRATSPLSPRGPALQVSGCYLCSGILPFRHRRIEERRDRRQQLLRVLQDQEVVGARENGELHSWE